MSSLMAKIGYVLAKRSMDKLRVRTDPRRYNGASLLGLNGVCVKSHGGTDSLGFATAIGVAVDMVRQGVNDSIAQRVEQMMERKAAEDQAGDASQAPVAS
jgi:glycerol-3-phosphate acyltransferase PlsX